MLFRVCVLAVGLFEFELKNFDFFTLGDVHLDLGGELFGFDG